MGRFLDRLSALCHMSLLGTCHRSHHHACETPSISEPGWGSPWKSSVGQTPWKLRTARRRAGDLHLCGEYYLINMSCLLDGPGGGVTEGENLPCRLLDGSVATLSETRGLEYFYSPGVSALDDAVASVVKGEGDEYNYLGRSEDL